MKCARAWSRKCAARRLNARPLLSVHVAFARFVPASARRSVARGYSGGRGGLTRSEPRANGRASLSLRPHTAASTPSRTLPLATRYSGALVPFDREQVSRTRGSRRPWRRSRARSERKTIGCTLVARSARTDGVRARRKRSSSPTDLSGSRTNEQAPSTATARGPNATPPRLPPDCRRTPDRARDQSLAATWSDSRSRRPPRACPTRSTAPTPRPRGSMARRAPSR